MIGFVKLLLHPGAGEAADVALPSAGARIAFLLACFAVVLVFEAAFPLFKHSPRDRLRNIGRNVASHAKALGMTFLRDVVSLKSGQDWDSQLLKLIDQADIFQLFWSPAAADSQYVRKEWLHALKRQREGFIWKRTRPVLP